MSASWVIIDKESNEVILETYNERFVKSIDTNKYEAVPIGKYLGRLNQPRKHNN